MSAAVHKLGRRLAARLLSLGRGRANGATVRILTYHRVNDAHPHDRLTVRTDAFAEQMEYLTRTENVVSLTDALASIRRPGRETAVAVTFDDGYLDNFENALPVLDRFRVKASFFVVTGIVGTKQVLERYQSCCASDGSMSWEQIRELVARGHEVGGHGRTHRELERLPQSDLEEEIGGCRKDLERETGRPPSFFCYPRGSENRAVRERVSASGFEAALTVYPGPNSYGSDPFALRRTEISGDDDLQDFGMKLLGRYDHLHLLIQAISRAGQS